VIKHIINAERYFWECVEKIPPVWMPVNRQPKPYSSSISQHIPLTVEDLSHNEQANQLFAQLIQEKHHIEQHQNNFDETKHQIQMLMKDAERATFANGSVTWKKSKTQSV
jgi:predicted phage-related endonuclease